MLIPNFIKAKTEAGLQNAIRSLYLKEGKYFIKEITILINTKGEYVFWYYSDKSGAALNLKD